MVRGTGSETLMEGNARSKCSLHDGKESHHPVGKTDGVGSRPQLKPFPAAVCSGSGCSSPARRAEHQESCCTPLGQEEKQNTSNAMSFTRQAGKVWKLRGCLLRGDGPPGLRVAPAKTLAYVMAVSPAGFLYWCNLPSHLYLQSLKGLFTSTKKTKMHVQSDKQDSV